MSENLFTKKENECVGFESRWRVKKISTVGSSQTTEYSLVEKETSTATTAEIETQTDDPYEHDVPEVDMQKLAEWLKKIYPSVKRELDEANNSQAFKNYCPSGVQVEAHTKIVQNIKVPSEKSDEILQVCALSWNSTGKTLAVSLNHNHKSWCHHIGTISLYTFTRNDELPENPSRKFQAESCFTVLKFHLNLPNILASGNYSGEILLWNLQYNDMNSLIAKINAHQEALTQLSWIHDIDQAKTVILGSSSLDGFLNLWSFNASSSTLFVKQKYNIKSPVLQRIKRQSEVPIEINEKIVRGVICFDFSQYLPDMFVVGVEGGLVVQCSMLGTNELKGSTKEVPLSDPVYKYYQPHEGEVIGVSFSPNRKEMFMSFGSEGEIHVFILDQDEPAQVIFLEKPLTAVSWIPFQEKIICGCGIKGKLEIFNLISGRPMKNTTKENVDLTTLTQMDLNKKRQTVLVTGNNQGEIQLWSAPWHLFSSKIL